MEMHLKEMKIILLKVFLDPMLSSFLDLFSLVEEQSEEQIKGELFEIHFTFILIDDWKLNFRLGNNLSGIE